MYVCAVESGPLRIVTHHLIADSIGRIGYRKLLEMGGGSWSRGRTYRWPSLPLLYVRPLVQWPSHIQNLAIAVPCRLSVCDTEEVRLK